LRTANHLSVTVITANSSVDDGVELVQEAFVSRAPLTTMILRGG
jgi:hypothetical protein